MSEPVTGGKLFALPYRHPDFSRGPHATPVQTAMLDHLVEHPMWFASSLSKEEIRVNAAWMLANNEYMKWEIWNGGRFAGGIFLSRVVVPVDALFHFTFFGAQTAGVSLFGAKKLLWNFLGYAFDTFGLRRISMEIPEHYPTLIRFVRQKLAFRYESEGDSVRFSKLRLKDDSPSMRAAVALHGSRRETSHWNAKTEKWEDVVLLRLTKDEYEARRSSGVEPNTTLETSNQGVSDVVGSETGNLRTSTSPG